MVRFLLDVGKERMISPDERYAEALGGQSLVAQHKFLV
jgi:hypothetical protein